MLRHAAGGEVACRTLLLDAGDALVLPPGTGFSLAAAGNAPFRAIVCLPVGGQAAFAGGDPFTPPWAE